MIKPLRMKPFYEFPKPLQFFGTRDATGMRMKQEMELNLMQWDEANKNRKQQQNEHTHTHTKNDEMGKTNFSYSIVSK